jgi:hypothetical protein
LKHLILTAVIGVFLIISAGNLSASEKAPQQVIDFAYSELMKLGTDPVIVSAVKEENAASKTLQKIKEMDEEWKAHAGIADYMQKIMDSECGKHLLNIQESAPYYAEIFVMDNQGANVAMTDKTSDYWQGDEAKFKESFKSGAGGVHISDVEFDDSSQAYIVQVSIPVKDMDSVIGAITVGIDVDKFE